MESSDMKNMVVLKNLPSNMVEEAIIIFKEKQKVKQKELVDKRNKINSYENKPKARDYILKEAEMLVTDYINQIENRKKFDNNRMSNQYKNLQKYSITVTIFLIVSIILNFI